MMNNAPRPSDIVIVSVGAILPDADSAPQFYDNVMAGRSSIQDVTKLEDNCYRQLASLVYNPRRGVADCTYTVMGAPINRGRLVEKAVANGVKLEEHFMQHIMAVEVVRQCIEGVLPPTARAETDFIFGRSSPSSDSISLHFEDAIRHIQKHGGEALIPLLQPELDRFGPARDKKKATDSLATKIVQHFGLGGLTLQTDAACASSLAALYVAVLRLRAGLTRYAIVGGADESLSHAGSLIAFSQIGVLTASSPLPFDKRSEGMAIGEGAVAFLLTTAEEASKAKLPILGIIKNINGSSDGRQGGLTEPTLEGQILCYQRVYGDEKPEMAFVEAHGTGTKVGDRAEMDSLALFFADHARLPIGSAKWNVGHTMGAAGVTGVLRALGILNRRTLPPSPYFEKFPDTQKTNLAVLSEKSVIGKNEAPLNIGVSSFGFGGANFHLWLQEYKEGREGIASKAEPTTIHDVVLCAEAEASLEDVAGLFHSTAYRLPPKAWPFIDKIQLLSVLLAEKIFRDNGINPAALDGDHMHVIADSGISLALNRELAERVAVQYALQYIVAHNSEKAEAVEMVRHSAMGSFSEMNDQFILGGLVSLIASRVTKAFNFRGVNFGVEADYASGLVAIETARTILQVSSGAALVFDVTKELDGPYHVFNGTGMRCTLIASLPFALEYNLPIKAKIGVLDIDRGMNAAA